MAPRHEDIIPHISPLFASIPELQCTNNSESGNTTPSAEPKFLAVNGTPLVTPKFPDDSNFLPVTPKFPDDLDPLPVTPKFPDDLDTHPVDPNFMVETDPPRDLATLGYILNMALTELHSAVPTPAALNHPSMTFPPSSHSIS